jgi:hypothetical protein
MKRCMIVLPEIDASVRWKSPEALISARRAVWPRSLISRLFFQQKLLQVLDLGWRDPGCGFAQDAGFDQPAGGEDLTGFIGRGVGNESAAVLLDADEAFIGQRLQGGACQCAADVEEIADIAFRQLSCQATADARRSRRGWRRGSAGRLSRRNRLSAGARWRRSS